LGRRIFEILGRPGKVSTAERHYVAGSLV
jgi:hypothetical protein